MTEYRFTARTFSLFVPTNGDPTDYSQAILVLVHADERKHVESANDPATAAAEFGEFVIQLMNPAHEGEQLPPNHCVGNDDRWYESNNAPCVNLLVKVRDTGSRLFRHRTVGDCNANVQVDAYFGVAVSWEELP